MAKAWQVLEPDPAEVEELAESFKLDRLLAKCMLNRNLRHDNEVNQFLCPDAYTPPDPFLIPQMDVAVERIVKALDSGERICIYGDYDADGVTAISILVESLRELGGDAFYYIPDRFFEGVGLNSKRLKRLQDDRVGLVITVDTGIRAFEEMNYAREIGLDVIITDHHTPDPDQPEAYAVLNPKVGGSRYPFHHLCGAGVALKIIQALDLRFPDTLSMSRYLAIAAIGTIADMVPLRQENRWIVRRGLDAIDREEVGPIRCLLRKLGIRGNVSALDISFKVAPRINAPGRLGDPDTAISFFRGRDYQSIARMVDIMDGMNTVRQMLERDLEAKMDPQLKYFDMRNHPFILVAGPHWHRGILGIMACKLLRRFSRPSCVLSFDSETAHGSIRCMPGWNILEVLHQIAPLLSSFGGHPEAAGVTLPVTNIPQFKSRMNELLASRVGGPYSSTSRSHAIDAVINWRDLSDRLFDNLRKMAPFGTGNALPVFLSSNLILESDLLRRGPWFHFEASDGAVSRKCSFYHPTDLGVHFERFDSVDLIYSLAPFRNEYQVQILEINPSKGS